MCQICRIIITFYFWNSANVLTCSLAYAYYALTAMPSNAARGKSRSPAPPPPSRPFLPPSHYAAAAGYSSSKPAKAPSSLDELNKAEPQTYQAVDYSQYDNFMPMSQHSPERSSPDSSSEYKLPRDTRFSFIAEARIISPRNSQREKRQSTLTGLPNIETQLLPSLRDTIDRMTRPPSRPPPSQTNQTDASAHRGRPPDPADVISLHDSRQMRSHHPAPEIDWMSDAPEITLSSHSNDTPPLVASTPKLKAPSHSPLKSSLRTPTPKLSPPDNAITHTPVQHASGGSLRSVKSFLGRKISFTTPPSSPAFVTNRSQTPRKSSLKVCIMHPLFLFVAHLAIGYKYAKYTNFQKQAPIRHHRPYPTCTPTNRVLRATSTIRQDARQTKCENPAVPVKHTAS